MECAHDQTDKQGPYQKKEKKRKRRKKRGEKVTKC